MVRGNKFMSDSACKHIVMNGGINFVSAQKGESPQVNMELVLLWFPCFSWDVKIPFVCCQKNCGISPNVFLQLPAVITPAVKAIAALPYVNCPPEKPDVEFKDGQIICATLDSLVDMLRPGANKSFTFTFLLCSRLYVKPHELLNKLCKRYFKNYDKIVILFFILFCLLYHNIMFQNNKDDVF